ncbi:MAG: LNR domain-containing protein [Myxococcota bacterium]
MTRWNLLLALLIAFGLQLGCHEDLDETSGSDEISELVETTQLNELIDVNKSTTGNKQIVIFTNPEAQYDTPTLSSEDNPCWESFGDTRVPNCAGATHAASLLASGSVDGCTETSWFGDGTCDSAHPDNLNCAATGWDGGDCKVPTRDRVEFFAYHNGCDVDAIPGLCHRELVAVGGSVVFTPDDIIRDYDDIVKIFTYVAEAVQAVVSIALTVVTAGAASGLIAEEVAEVAGDAASAFLEISEETADAVEVGLDTANFEDDFLNLSVRTTSGGPRFSWAEKLAVKMGMNVPLGMIEGGLKGGQDGAGAAFKGALEAFGNTLAGSVESIGGAKGFLSFAKSLGSNAESLAFTGIKDMEIIAADVEGGLSKSARLRNFAAFLWNSAGSAESDRPSYVINAAAKTFFADTKPSLWEAFKNELNLVPKVGAAMTLVTKGTHLALQIVDDEGETQNVSFNRGHIQRIVDRLSDDPSFEADVSDYVRQNVPIERGVRALAVAHNLWVNAPDLHEKLAPLFETEAEVSDLYTGYLPAAMLTGAETLNADYHLAISAEDHTLYARLNTSFVAGNLEESVHNELLSRDFKTEGYAVASDTLKKAGYLPLHELTDVDTQNIQNLMMCTRIAMGMPVSIKLWSNKEWNYLAGYRGKLYRNIAGFLRNEQGAPSFDHWTTHWYAPGHPKHNTFWEEIVGFTGQVGTYAATQTTADATAPLLPLTKGLFINQDHHLHMEVKDITDEELSQWNANGEPGTGWNDGCGATKDRLIAVTLKAAEAINWWKGLNVSVLKYNPATCEVDPAAEPNSHGLEVKADGAPMTLYIPVGNFKEWLSALEAAPGNEWVGNVFYSLFEFKVENCFAVPFDIGASFYNLEDLVGKHITVTWVTEGSSGSDFYGVPGEYDLHGDQSDVVVSSQGAHSDTTGAMIGFAIHPGISWWKGIALRKSDGTKLWLTKNDLVGNVNDGFVPDGTTALFQSDDPVSEWGYHVHVEFWKEVTPGVNYYQKAVKIKTEDLQGYYTNFLWKYDGTNYGPIRNSYVANGGHDNISVQIEDLPADRAAFPGGMAQVRFAVAPGITWWKAIKVVLVNGATEMLWTHTSTQTTGLNPLDSSSVINVYPALIPSGSEVRVQFWKKVTPGVNYYVGDAKIDFDSIAGKSVTFIWEND